MDDLLYAEFEALLIMQNRLIGNLDSELRNYNLSVSSFLALHFISNGRTRSGSTITRARIAEHLGINTASVTPLIRRLIDLGLVQEKPHDARSKELLITSKGKFKLQKSNAAWKDTFKLLDAALSPNMKSQLMRAITKINVVAQHQRDEERRLMLMRTATVRDTLDVLDRQNRDAKAKARKIEDELDAH